MEIKDYLQAIGRRKWILIAVPAVSGMIAAGILVPRPREYRASATVVSPAVSSSATNTQVITFVANFTAALDSRAVVEKVADEAGTSPDDVDSGLKSKQLGTSSIVEVSYTGTKPAVVTKVAAAAALAGLTLLDEAALTEAEKEVEQAESSYDEAAQEIFNFADQTGLVLPDETFRIDQQEISSLEVAIIAARAEGNGTLAAELQKRLDQKIGVREQLGNQVLEFQRLRDGLTQASVNVERAKAERNAARARLEADQEETTISARPASEVARVPLLARRLATVVATGLIFAIGLIVLLEVVAPTGVRTRGPTRSRTSDDEAPGLAGLHPITEPDADGGRSFRVRR